MQLLQLKTGEQHAKPTLDQERKAKMTWQTYAKALIDQAKSMRPVDPAEEAAWRSSRRGKRERVKADLFVAVILHDGDLAQSWEYLRHLAIWAEELGIEF